MNLLFIGDVVGKNGCNFLLNNLPNVKRQNDIDITIVNGENSAQGNGIHNMSYKAIVSAGADVITTGNHAFRRNDCYSLFEDKYNLLRPANFPEGCIGVGVRTFDCGKYSYAVVNLMGTALMDALDNPLTTIDSVLKTIDTPNIFVDFHAEATAEKKAMGYYLAKRVTAVLGTHTHVPTADETIIDGHTAYTGGVNLSDEYINHVERFGHWKDTAIKVHGEAVVNFTRMFFNMWNYTNSTSENNYKKYFPHVYHPQAFTDDGYVMPYGDIPIDNENVGKNVYLDIINKAKKYVYIMTPYLILDNEMVTALSIASKSGIDVRIIVPGIPDKWYAYGIAQSFFKDLTKVGVKVYTYSKGFVHAKSFVSDDHTAVVGSINLDFRSLYLHFEDAVFMYKSSAVGDVKQDFLDTLKSCNLIDEDYIKNIPLWKKTINALLRMLSPML